jgi:Tol biopolymer transport system component
MFHTCMLRSRISAVLTAGVIATGLVGCSSDSPTGPGGGGPAVIPPILAWQPSSTTGGATVIAVNSDGTGARTITTTTTRAGSAQATQAGKLIVFSDATMGGAEGLFVIDQSGTRRALVTPSGQISAAFDPIFSPDSQWVYFRATMPASQVAGQPVPSGIWKVKLDGTGLAQVGAPRPLGQGAPSIAPDQRTLMTTDADAIVFLGLQSGAIHTVPAQCADAQYSPDGLHIACVSNGQLIVSDAQFTASPVTIGGGGYDPNGGIDWAPDGKTILVSNATTGPELVAYPAGTITTTTLGTSYTRVAFVK